MDATTTAEKQVLAEIELLREKFPQTQDLYREVCILLFFRHGITPTANKLYQLVRKGSMSAPAEALTRFWNDLREKSRVKIEHPDLPEELKAAAGALTAAIWSKAQDLAHESLSTHQALARAAVQEAQAALTAAESERDNALHQMQSSQEAFHRVSDHANTLEQSLTAEKTTRKTLEAQLQQAGSEIVNLHSMLDRTRQEFAAELDKQRASTALAEERFRVSEERALLEIDRERTISARLQKELDRTRTNTNELSERHRKEISVLHTSTGELHQRIGSLEGSLREANFEKDKLASEVNLTRDQLTDAIIKNTLLESEVNKWRLMVKNKAVKRPQKVERRQRGQTQN